jgi:hypothetical protein
MARAADRVAREDATGVIEEWNSRIREGRPSRASTAAMSKPDGVSHDA